MRQGTARHPVSCGVTSEPGTHEGNIIRCCRVFREGDTHELDAEELVPGDIVLLESCTFIATGSRLCHLPRFLSARRMTAFSSSTRNSTDEATMIMRTHIATSILVVPNRACIGPR